MESRRHRHGRHAAPSHTRLRRPIHRAVVGSVRSKRFMVFGAVVTGVAAIYGSFINKPSRLYTMVALMSVG